MLSMLGNHLTGITRWWLACSLLLLVLLPARAVEPAAPTDKGEDFGQYLVAHEDDVAPVFSKNKHEFIRAAAPLFITWAAEVTFLGLLVDWGFDVLLGRGYAMLFVTSKARFRPALIYATGRLILNALLAAVLGTVIILVSGSHHLMVLGIFLFLIFFLANATMQIGWIYYFYRTKMSLAVLFFLTLLVVHGFTLLAIGTPLARMPASTSARDFTDRIVVPKMQAEVKAVRQELILATQARNQVSDQAGHLRDQIDQAHAEAAEVQKQLDQARNSESYLYSRIVKIHAQGDLITARNQLAALLARFPNGPMTGLARGQLIQITSELGAQESQRKAVVAEDLRAAALARASLLEHARKGQASLSEMRSALFGKTRAQVSSLFGPPTEIASDRWGFSQPMILNPLTNEKSGLTVYFSEGIVQGVDYYYGKAPSS